MSENYQSNLFGDTPPHTLSRRDDEVTSKAAAEEHVKSGAHASLKALAFDLVKKHPGKTSWELCVLAGKDDPDSPLANIEGRFRLARVLPVIMREGLVKKDKIRKCTESPAGRQSVTWMPLEHLS